MADPRPDKPSRRARAPKRAHGGDAGKGGGGLFREAVPVGLVDLDGEGRILRANAVAAAILGYRFRMERMPFIVFLGRGSAVKFHANLRRCRENMERRGVDLTLSSPRGQIRSVHVVCEPFAVMEEGAAFRLAILDVAERRSGLHAVHVKLGRLALGESGITTEQFFGTVVKEVARAVGATWVVILEHLPEESGLIPRSARGLGRGSSWRRLNAGEHPAAEAVLATGFSAWYPDLRKAKTDRLPDFLSRRGPVSAAINLIPGSEAGVPYGTLEIYGEGADAFRESERMFLESVANLLGSFLRSRKAETGLKESGKRFRQVVENAPIGFSVIRGDEVVFMNPVQKEILGRGEVPFPVRKMEAKIHPEDAVLFQAAFESIRVGSSRRQEANLRLQRKRAVGGNVVRWVHMGMNAFPWYGEEAILVSMADVTRTKELETITLNQERMATLGRVTAGIAHEVRSPLSAVNIHISQLEKAVDDAPGLDPEFRDTVRKTTAKVIAASGKIEAVIRRALDFSRTMPVPMAPLSVNECIRESLALTHPSVVRNRIELSASLQEDLPPCKGDRQLLKQVLVNLLTNSVQAMEIWKGDRKISVTSALKDGMVVISIADSGPGIPEEIRARIFEPFFTTRSSGTGIGLSLSRMIVTALGGSIWVGNSDLGGALVSVLLPTHQNGPSYTED